LPQRPIANVRRSFSQSYSYCAIEAGESFDLIPMTAGGSSVQ